MCVCVCVPVTVAARVVACLVMKQNPHTKRLPRVSREWTTGHEQRVTSHPLHAARTHRARSHRQARLAQTRFPGNSLGNLSVTHTFNFRKFIGNLLEICPYSERENEEYLGNVLTIRSIQKIWSVPLISVPRTRRASRALVSHIARGVRKKNARSHFWNAQSNFWNAGSAVELPLRRDLTKAGRSISCGSCNVFCAC